jgi:hypothetical protein
MLKLILKKQVVMVWKKSRYSPNPGYCEFGNEPSDSTKDGDFDCISFSGSTLFHKVSS